jgi:hypothetical protein
MDIVIPSNYWQLQFLLIQVASIPDTIEAENFDEGDEGISVHESDYVSTTGIYRPEYAVDIETLTGGGYMVGYMEPAEWLEYTVNVVSAGDYTVDALQLRWMEMVHSPCKLELL